MTTDPKVLAFLRDLYRIPELCAQLDVTITRTDVMRRPGSDYVRGGGDEQPLLLNDHASECRRNLVRTLRYAAARVPYAPRALTPAQAATAILDDMPNWIGRPWVTTWIADVSRVITAAWGACDAPAPRAFAGLCSECGATVSGPQHLRILKCRCGAEYDATARREWMAQNALGYIGTPTELARTLPAFHGVTIAADRIRKWIERGKLTGIPCEDDGQTRYRIGDVLDLHRAQQARRRPTVAA